jgi:hypothetical protein
VTPLPKHPSSGTHAPDFTWLQAFQTLQHVRHEDYKIVKAGAAAIKHDDGNAAAAKVLLVWHVLIDGD